MAVVLFNVAQKGGERQQQHMLSCLRIVREVSIETVGMQISNQRVGRRLIGFSSRRVCR